MLPWGNEYCGDEVGAASWCHGGTNVALDFHGDPAAAELVVFSDGNHHMALLEAICEFRKRSGVGGVFYTTTPPAPLVAAFEAGRLRLGNLLLSVVPHVFISPDFILEPLRQQGRLGALQGLFSSRGNVLLVPKGNPKGIHGIADLGRPDVRLFLSNPETERASYGGYRQTLDVLAARAGVDLAGATEGDGARIVYGERIHHREAPEAVAGGLADCAVVYHHLGLRYARIFPEQLEMLPLDEGRRAGSHLAVVGDGGRWGQRFADFMVEPATAAIYRRHGMDHAA